MAILKNVVPVNNGNTGWTKTNVLDALEETFADLGWHDGSQVNGVVCTTQPPGSAAPHNNGGYGNGNWRWCGGAGPNESYLTAVSHWYSVTASGNSYLMQQFYLPTNINSTTADAVIVGRHGLTTGDPVVFSGVTTINTASGPLVNNETYYAIVLNTNTFRLATTAENATAGTAIDITTNTSSADVRFTRPQVLTNPTIQIYQSDVLYFYTNNIGDPLSIQDASGAYSTQRVLSTANYNTISYRTMPGGQGNETGTVSFNTNGWRQGDYYYVSHNDALKSGIIRVLPNTYVQADGFYPYWDYTVPASEGKSSLTLRVHRFARNNSYNKSVAGIEVISSSSGWLNDDVFTIPGNQIGGTTPANDIVFGVNSATTVQQNASNAVPSIKVTNLGAGVNFYQKFPNQSKALLKVVNDSQKTYGTTYYGFNFNPSNNYQFQITSGINWDHLNYNPNSSDANDSGRFTGTTGLDFSSDINTNFSYETNNIAQMNYATSATPTAYPLKIITYKAQSPQDTNFAIIQFVQTINEIDVSYSCFFLHKGTAHGNGVWDLNHVWQGSYTEIYDTTQNGEGVVFTTRMPNKASGAESLGSFRSIKRESYYGYLRDAGSYYEGQVTMAIRNNLFTDNDSDYIGYYNQGIPANIFPYYRNNAYDKSTFSNSTTSYNKNDISTTLSVSSSANYYRPIKGLPISNSLAPCPYYLPDDYVAIQFAVTPGATAFRPGDTITVSPSEMYEIIKVSYSTQQQTYDNVANNTSKGIALCARVV